MGGACLIVALNTMSDPDFGSNVEHDFLTDSANTSAAIAEATSSSHESAVGIVDFGSILTIVLGLVAIYVATRMGQSNGSQAEVVDANDDKEDGETERPPKKVFPPEMKLTPDENRKWTVETLREHDGERHRMFLCVCGKVFDVQDSDNFRPDFGISFAIERQVLPIQHLSCVLSLILLRQRCNTIAILRSLRSYDAIP